MNRSMLRAPLLALAALALVPAAQAEESRDFVAHVQALQAHGQQLTSQPKADSAHDS